MELCCGEVVNILESNVGDGVVRLGEKRKTTEMRFDDVLKNETRKWMCTWLGKIIETTVLLFVYQLFLVMVIINNQRLTANEPISETVMSP